jgi:hypothetical protein
MDDTRKQIIDFYAGLGFQVKVEDGTIKIMSYYFDKGGQDEK